ncbi:hypothetical protein [Streptomyces lavendulae]|uniref:pPIWI_RE_Z domain-containing protein n=1 Tax=Streptomyces lavendulae TaxID=1914 RepID=UPI00249FFC02|nr:hypothetical protein [Streptomyces lavendulae]GLX23891.1 hypothetical protein Slala01_75350 [Streptomyces lavendulae subsp. lavendulae]GLX31658.1 hypothetical protein Slala02_74770 [Streptomyces lavendulae subsp. lavendulae]
MRTLALPLKSVIDELEDFSRTPRRRRHLEQVCRIELGLFLQQQFHPGAPALDAWPLFSGYPYAVAQGIAVSREDRHRLRVARYAMWTLSRPRAWEHALEWYQRFDPGLRGYDVPDPSEPAVRTDPAPGADRWAVYGELLDAAPPFVRRRATTAGPGPYEFVLGRHTAPVELPDLPGLPPVPRHDLDMPPANSGDPLHLSRSELLRTAALMDEIDHQNWVKRLNDLVFHVRFGTAFAERHAFTIDGIQHLLGIVGAGKSTLRDIVAVHLTRERGMRVTVVVNDVADVLRLVRLYNTYAPGSAVPVIGVTGREQHAQRLHRRLASRGEHRLAAHDDPAFEHLGTSCAVNALRVEGKVPGAGALPYGAAPCSGLMPMEDGSDDPPEEDGATGTRRGPSARFLKRRPRHVCPFWGGCPRHHSSRGLVDAPIWVATSASLVDARPPRPQNAESIRYLELACRRSDLVIIDEVDRVQMHFDRIFAPAVPLVDPEDPDNSFIDNLMRHTNLELATGARLQLSDRYVQDWTAALHTAKLAIERLYGMLVADGNLREQVRSGYFSAWTLQAGLVEERHPVPESAEEPDLGKDARDRLTDLFGAFRDDPFGDRGLPGEHDTAELTSLLFQVLHTDKPEQTRARLGDLMDRVFDMGPAMEARQAAYDEAKADEAKGKARTKAEGARSAGRPPKGRRPKLPAEPATWHRSLLTRFEFMLVLSALEPRLALINAIWPQVQGALNLDFNSLYRRPDDYGPMVPEAPMGNVLGFRFRPDGPRDDGGGVGSGELSFFRCSGLGRGLLQALPTLATVDGRPTTNLLLLSGSSWAGASNRYHVPSQVGIVLEPRDRGDAATASAESSPRRVPHIDMRMELVREGGEAVTVSGSGMEERLVRLERIAMALGASSETFPEGGPLERELGRLAPERSHILLLVGSYEEAALVADTLHNLNDRWHGRVLRLVPDGEDTDDADPADRQGRARVLRRGDVERLEDCRADVLVAPLLAMERGHNILNSNGEAAIGSVYFLVRPNPHPEDLSLAVSSINSWMSRALDDGRFDAWAGAEAGLAAGALRVRAAARSEWYRVLRRRVAWSRLKDADRTTVTWDLMVVVWQVIGRLVRGGVPARVAFVDAAFTPNGAAVPASPDTAESSLLHSMADVLRPYFTHGTDVREDDRFIVTALYEPLWKGLERLLRPLPGTPKEALACTG